jgi:hypothetical protein
LFPFTEYTNKYHQQDHSAIEQCCEVSSMPIGHRNGSLGLHIAGGGFDPSHAAAGGKIQYRPIATLPVLPLGKARTEPRSQRAPQTTRLEPNSPRSPRSPRPQQTPETSIRRLRKMSVFLHADEFLAPLSTEERSPRSPRSPGSPRSPRAPPPTKRKVSYIPPTDFNVYGGAIVGSKEGK